MQASRFCTLPRKNIGNGVKREKDDEKYVFWNENKNAENAGNEETAA